MIVSPSKMLQVDATNAFKALVHQDSRDNSSNETLAGRTKGTPSAVATRRTSSNTEFDLQARRLIIQQVHSKSGSIISQFPNEALLKIREYLSNQPSASLSMHTDLNA